MYTVISVLYTASNVLYIVKGVLYTVYSVHSIQYAVYCTSMCSYVLIRTISLWTCFAIINKQVTEACTCNAKNGQFFYNISIKTKPYRQLFGEVRTQSGPGFDHSLVCTQTMQYVFLLWIHSDGRVYLCNTVHKLSLQLYVQSWASRERGEQNSLPKYVPLVVKL